MPVISGGGVRAGWDEQAGRLTVEVDGGASHAFRLLPGAGRVRLGLELAVRSRPVDVSCQPGLLDAALTAPGRDAPAGDVARTVAAWLAAFAEASGAPVVVSTVPAAVAGGAAFPMLAEAYAEGRAPLPELPRWAAPALAAVTARACADAAVARRASRRLVAALAASLLAGPAAAGAAVASVAAPVAVSAPAGPQSPVASVASAAPSLAGLALVRLGAAVLDDDRLAALAGAAVWRAADELVTVDELPVFARLAERAGPDRTHRYLRDAGTTEAGAAQLRVALRLFATAGRADLGALPTTLDGLVDHLHTCHPAVAPVEAPPPPLPVALPAPVPSTGRAAALDPAPDLRAVDQAELLGGRLRLVLPASTAQLAEWGRRLHNCLDGFDTAAERGLSRIVGVEVDDRLAYALELDPTGGVRQFLAARNRPVPEAHAAEVVAFLRDRGVVP